MVKLDENMIKRCLDGDRRAQMHLYSAFYKRVFNSCFRILRDKGDAEDAMQESFVKAFSRLRQFDGAVPFEAWIVRIAINTSIDRLRESRLEVVDCDETRLEGFEDSREEDDWEHTLERAAQVKAAIERLPDASRIIVTLYLLEGYDHDEIAQILNITGGTARIQYMRAKQKLIQLLK
ncbi:ECF RNA polymerase sigma-E factor [Bacteroidia bacterium]|nr:ECF RNA polymerase sigma-E factor [Bacteroidia bacterium]